MKPVVKKVNRRERLMPVKNEPCFERKAIMLSGCCPSGDRGIGKVGSEIELCSATFLRGVAHPKSPLTETVTLVEIEDSHSMMELDKAVTQTVPVAAKGWSRRRHASRRRSGGVPPQIYVIIWLRN